MVSLFKVPLAVLALVLAGFSSTPFARDRDVDKEGYTLLASSRSLEGADQAEVVVFFHYACPHCDRLYTDHLRHWFKKNPTRRVSFVPVTWAPPLVPFARAYHAGAQAKLHPAYHEALFAAVRKDFSRPKDKAFFADIAAQCCGVDPQDFETLYDSDAVQQRTAADADILRRVGVERTPTVLVAGKYLLSTASAGGAEALIRLMDELVDK
jgi:protein dithiol oxidoreductase (disulfide-forming)